MVEKKLIMMGTYGKNKIIIGKHAGTYMSKKMIITFFQINMYDTQLLLKNATAFTM